MSQGPLCPNLTKKVQAEVSQMANRNLSHVILLGGLSVNLNHLKRKKSYKTTVFSESISPNKVIKAVEFLVANSEMYKSYNIDLPTWLRDIENSTHDNQYFIEGNNPTVDQSLVNLEKNNSNNDTNFEEISSSEISQGNMDTMLIEHVNTVTEDGSDSPQDSTGNKSIHIDIW